MGSTALLVENPPGDPASWSNGLRSLGISGVVDVVPAAETVLIRCESEHALDAVVGRLEAVIVGDDAVTQHPTVTIPVRYDGEDLIDVAESVGCSVDDVIALHSGARYRVAFCGFAPGFGYLRGLPDVLHLPRRDTPRTSVPAGSVAIASEFSAVYPRRSPGGWHLLGTTEVTLFDARLDPPAVLVPGARVEFLPR